MKKINLILILALQLFCFQAMAQDNLNYGRDGGKVPSAPPVSEETPSNDQLKNGSDADIPGNYENPVAQDDWKFPADLQVIQEDLMAGVGSAEVIERVNVLSNQVDALVLANEQLRQENELIRKSLSACCSAAEMGLSATDAYLFQNAPNPFSESSEIKYYVPEGITGATLEIRGLKGEIIEIFDLNISGYGKVNVSKALNSGSGTYIYYLNIGGEVIDSKVMIFTK